MSLIKKLKIQNYFTREEIIIILFILSFTFLGIGIKSYKTFISKNQFFDKFENRSLDSILVAVFSEEKVDNIDLGKSKEEKVLQPKSININEAGLEELALLPGIGEKTAQKIIEYRTKFGSFKKIEDIMNVPRIGSRTFENIKEFITIK